MSKTNAKEFFERAVAKNILGDIQYLKSNHGGRAGPLLSCVANGIDVMGGILYGFETGSADRSKRFMATHMSLSTDLANATYRVVRCGVTHEGGPKLGLLFFVHDGTDQADDLFFKRNDKAICLDVLALASRFETAVKQVAEDSKLIANQPDIDANDAASWATLVNGLPSYEERFESDGVSPETSGTPSHYDPSGYEVKAVAAEGGQ